MENKKIRASHVIAHQEPQKVIDQVEAFKKGKADFQAVYSTTPVMAGVQAGTANMVIVTSCLCTWETTPEDFRAWQQRQKLSLGSF